MKFMYGVDEKKNWFDYELANAYTRGMSNLSHPVYSRAKLQEPDTIIAWNSYQLLKWSLIINCN